ncbi:MAG: hypothetical protein PW786_12830 [Arachidicoccus sp.]|nr:hypothetical protein [Arachidicoccus sp.]
MQAADRSNQSDIMHNSANSETKCYGLFNGKAGRAILFYLLSTNSDKDRYKEQALKNLDEIAENIASIESLGFAKGLAGIGWMVEWVAQNGFLEMNTDEILEEIDDTLYKSVVYSSDKNISLSKGILGKILFFSSRYKSKNPNTHRLKSIFHEECLVLLTDDLQEKISGDEGLLFKENLSNEDLINIGHVIYFFGEFLWTKVNEQAVEKGLYDCMDFLDRRLGEDVDNINRPNSQNIRINLFLACCFYLAGRKHQLNIWQDKGLKYINTFRNFYLTTHLKGALEDNFIILADLILNEPVSEIKRLGSFTLTNYHGKQLIQQLTLQYKINFDTAISLLLLQ